MDYTELYTQPGCGKCMVLKRVLDTKNYKYKIIDDSEKVIEKAKEVGTTELPILYVNGNYYSGTEAVNKGKEV